MKKAMIHVENVTKSFGSLPVLNGVSFDIQKGEVVSIVGSSGAGKSTLLQIIGTLDAADSGKVLFDGVDVQALRGAVLSVFRNRHIGFVFQFHRLLPEFTALENVMMPALIGGASQKEAAGEALKLLDMMGLRERVDHKPAELSGGEKQRVAVARSLINKPDVVLADEPSGSLDVQGKAALHKLFFDLRDSLGQTFVIVTHDETLADMADRTLRLSDGMITESRDKD